MASDDKEFPWTPLAMRALGHQAAERTDIAQACVRRLVEKHGSEVVPQVLLAWVDVTIGTVWPDGPPPTDRGMVWWNTETGDIGGADDVPPPVRWAGRFVMARLADDEDQANALIDSVGSDEAWVDCVVALLGSCGAMIREFAPQPGRTDGIG